MIKTDRWLVVAVLAGCFIFMLSPALAHLFGSPDIFEFREQFIYLTGVLAIVSMTLAMLTAARFGPVNKIMGGLDKAYVLHKRAGVLALIFGLTHWLLEKVPQWLVELEIIPHPGELGDPGDFSELEIFLFQSGVLAAWLIFFVFIALIAISLTRKVPYSFFLKTHKFFPIVYIFLVYHSATALLKEYWFNSPAGYILLAFFALGCFVAVLSLRRRIGFSRKRKAAIDDIKQYGDTVVVSLRTSGKPFIRSPGQFAFLQFLPGKEAHPFTVASASNDPHEAQFAIKGLGDFTRKLSESISLGGEVVIEGPYGEFHFEDSRDRQVWIAGGIGVTPFMARLDHLLNHGGTKKPVDFWFSTRGDLAAQFPPGLQSLCESTGVSLHHVDSKKDGRLSVAQIQAQVGDLSKCSFWFCGPERFGESIISDLKSVGFDLRNFHFDNFDMR